MGSHCIVGLDIGTSSIKAVVVEPREGALRILAVFKEPTHGVRRGVITDTAEVAHALTKIFSDIRKVSRAGVKNVYTSIGTPHVKSQMSKGLVTVSRADNEIYEEDLDRVIHSSKTGAALGLNRTIVYHEPREYVVDGVGEIFDPLGLNGSRLEVNSLLVDAFSPHVNDLARVIQMGGGNVIDLALAPIVAARSALTRRQRELGTMIVDIGAATTGIGIYEEDKLIGVCILPVGAANVTNDIAIALKIPVDIAEQVKLQYGYAIEKEIGPRDAIDLKKLYPEARGIVSRRLVGQVIEMRLAEILDLVNNELKVAGKSGQLPGGAVLVGGGAKLPGITELVRQELRLASQIGLSGGEEWKENDSFIEHLEDPELVTAFGLALRGMDKIRGGTKKSFWRPRSSFLRYFLP